MHVRPSGGGGDIDAILSRTRRHRVFVPTSNQARQSCFFFSDHIFSDPERAKVRIFSGPRGATGGLTNPHSTIINVKRGPKHSKIDEAQGSLHARPRPWPWRYRCDPLSYETQRYLRSYIHLLIAVDIKVSHPIRIACSATQETQLEGTTIRA